MDKGFRGLPSVDKVLSDERIVRLDEAYSHPTVLQAVRDYLGEVREHIEVGDPVPSFDRVVDAICARIHSMGKPSLRPAINATGVILHTNLGRAPLSREASAAMEECAGSFVNLEIDLDSGKRGSRQVHVESLLCRLTGAEAALVVNNNAAAVLLALSAVAKRKEVIVSRGQAVEIGGGFRIPDVMRQSGARLIEVGTTNRTYLSDYEEAITERTAALLRVHSSNFKVVGFEQSVSIEELVRLGSENDIPVLDDLGSGCLLDTTRFGLDPEPTVQHSIASGVGLAMFSADKLLGGSQGGVIVGREAMVDKLRRHPLARAVRVDKIVLAGLAATLLHYVKGEAEDKVPVWRMISMPLSEIEARSRTWSEALGGSASVVEGESMIGGGSLPGDTLPTCLVRIKVRGKIQKLAGDIRKGSPVVIGRVESNSLFLDPRTVLPEEDEVLVARLRAALTQ
ncbi:MAG: L-seryl-tRNA(Sec) selenium transferase [Chloroflexota bacterium]|nr:L-seryl-tRNA(Sec) selenium transferase [Chloroflexota bacterium]